MDSQSLSSLERFDVQALSSSYSTLALFKVSLVSTCLFLTGVFRLWCNETHQKDHFIFILHQFHRSEQTSNILVKLSPEWVFGRRFLYHGSTG